MVGARIVLVVFVVSGCAVMSEHEMEERRRAMLIEPSELEARLHEGGLRILDTRSSEAHAAGHIPGAVRVDVDAWRDLGRTPGGFRDAEAWARLVGEVGVGADSHVVVYGDSLSNTARIWWLLKYLGVEEAMILNGGWNVWVKEGRPTEIGPREVDAVAFTPRFDADRLTEIDALKEMFRSGSFKLVDTRSDAEFTGTDARGPRGGHIPGATHLEWKELVAEDGRFKTVPELQALFRERGILPSETAVCY